MYPDKNMLEQLKNLSVYAKQLKEISSFLRQTPNFYDTVKQYQNFADNIQKNPQQQIQALEQFRSFFRTYEKEIKETFSENQIARFEKEYDEISSNPNETGKETLVIFFMCVVLTILDVAPIPYANLIKSLTEAFIAKYADDENIKSYLDKFSKAIIDFLDDNFINKRK